MSPNASLAVARTSTTNTRRLALLICFSLAMVAMNRFAASVDEAMFAIFIAWIGAVAVYQIVLGRVVSAAAVDRLQTIAFLLDLTFLSIVYAALGGASWMGASMHAVIAMSAFAALPASPARIVAAYAAVTFVAGVIANSTGLGLVHPMFEMPATRSNYDFALGASIFGLLTLVGGASVQYTFVRIMRRAQERNRLILDTAPDWIVMTNDAGVISSASKATSTLTGRVPDSLIGSFFPDLVLPELRVRVASEISETVRDGRPRQFETRYLAPDGSMRWLLCSATAVRDDVAVTGALIIARDVTDRMTAADELRTREAMLAETEQLADIGSWRWEVEKDAVEWSDQLYRIFGMTKNGQLTSREFFERVHPEDVGRIRTIVERGLELGQSFEFDHRIVRADGTIRSLHSRGRVSPGPDGRGSLVAGSVQDITERTSLTDQLRQAQKMEAVGRLAGGISHDFNNILMVMRTYADILEESLGADDERRKRDVEQISKAIGRASSLTRQLLVFSRRQAVEMQSIDLNKAVSSFGGMISRVVGEDVVFKTKLADGLWPVDADPGQIEQVLMNLVVNARDAMPTGGLLTIETGNAEIGEEYTRTHMIDPGSYALLSVTDSGLGMTREVQGKVFEPFFTTKDPGSGTGLGLSIVYGIVKQCKGHIWLYSEPEKGTTVKIYLPRSDAGESGLSAVDRRQEVSGGVESILLVEDEESVREALSLTLRDRGYTVIEASNGAEALRLCEDITVRVDLVLTDMVMPGIGGRDLARHMLAMRPDIPVLFMSGYTEDSIAARGMPLKAAAFLEKPFTASALLIKTREMLDAAAQ